MNEKVERLLVHHEGLKLKPYRCSAGKLTIGVGHNIEDNGITQGEAMVLLRNDLLRVEGELRGVFNGEMMTWPEARQAALLDMLFNLGLSRFLGFRRLIAAVHAGQWDQAAAEMLASKWAKQVGQRAHTLATMMRTGQWPAVL